MRVQHSDAVGIHIYSGAGYSHVPFSPSVALAGNGGDPDKYKDVPPNVRQWFKSVKSPFGIPCCDIADGYRTDVQHRVDGYWVYIGGDWRQVPAVAVVSGHENPTGDAVVWYIDNNPGASPSADTPGRYFIRCFVPGPEL